jgi:hypothetical protein
MGSNTAVPDPGQQDRHNFPSLLATLDVNADETRLMLARNNADHNPRLYFPVVVLCDCRSVRRKLPSYFLAIFRTNLKTGYCISKTVALIKWHIWKALLVQDCHQLWGS